MTANDRPLMFACALRDELLERLKDPNDIDARRLIEMTIPLTIPPRIAMAVRDARIKCFAFRIRALIPNISEHALAVMLANAGARIARSPNATSREIFHALEGTEADRLRAEIQSILEWAPANSRGERWPRWRRMTEIIEFAV